jgi:hypothetical protein
MPQANAKLEKYRGVSKGNLHHYYDPPSGSTKINTNEHTKRVITTPQTFHPIY